MTKDDLRRKCEEVREEEIRVHSLFELCELAMKRKSVVAPNVIPWNKPTPAAFVQNLQGVIINRLIEKGLFVYEPKKGKKK